ncbi:hypothetical protein VARIO8X_120523 [Burkholderiales bacterium 8X]|nr:hypothetical protein VARIO8X_120523 [Burkholderiales bacterium 8X]
MAHAFDHFAGGARHGARPGAAFVPGGAARAGRNPARGVELIGFSSLARSFGSVQHPAGDLE